MKKKIVKLILLSFFLAMILIGSIISPISAQTPVIDIGEDKDTWIPTGMYDGFYYYVNPPDTDFSDVMYRGSSGYAQYSTLDNVGSPNYESRFDWSYTVLFKNNYADAYDPEILRNTFRTSRNPFFEDEAYPQAVKMYSIYNPVFEQSQKKAINLHMDYSSTFLAEGNVQYLGFINSSEPFFLDVHVHDFETSGTINFPSAFPDFTYSIGNTWKKMTYPVFPQRDSPIPVNFTLTLDDPSLVTLTPHPWEYPDWVPIIEVNTTFSGEFDQGALYNTDQKTGDWVYPLNDIFSIRMFNLSLVEGEYYKIYTNYQLQSWSVYPLEFLLSEHFEYISGYFDKDGYYFYAEKSENVTLVLLSLGLLNGEYTLFFQNISPAPELYETQPLTLNDNITLELDTYYTFTFEAPHMMAINSTYGLYDLNLYTQGTESDEWIEITMPWSIESGNLFGESAGDIANGDWTYIPSGTYAFSANYFKVGEEITFTTVPVQQPGLLQVNQNSLFAIELPVMKNRISYFNLSTNDQIFPIQRVMYEWTFVGKYNEQILPDTSSLYFGNSNSSGNWLAWNINDTYISELLPTRDFEVPILMLRPFAAEQNTTMDALKTFSASLTVSANVALNQWSVYSGKPNIGYGYFIPLSSISTTETFEVNDDYSSSLTQLYGIPLDLDPYSIYNITVYLYGNYTTTQPNATFDSVSLHGGNLQDLRIFDSMVAKNFVTNSSRSMLILTVSSISYLYVDVDRTVNATMEVVITKISTTNMNFNLPEYKYNDTISSLEVYTEDLLATQIIPPEMKKQKRASGFELAFTVGTLVILTTGISLRRRKR